MGESQEVEFKGALRTNLHTKQQDDRVTCSVLRTIIGFLNKNGGTLLVGLLDEGQPIGYQADGFQTEEATVTWLIDLLTERIGAEHLKEIHPRFEEYDGVRVLILDCWPSQTPAYLKHDGQNVLFIRHGATTIELSGEQAAEYVERRFAPKLLPAIPAPPPAEETKKNPKEHERYGLRKQFWAELLEKEKKLTDLHAKVSPGEYNWVGRGFNGVWLNYCIREHDGQAELYIDVDKDTGEGNKHLFDSLKAKSDEIEQAFGGPLDWERLDKKRACRIRKVVSIGGWRDMNSWPTQQDEMIDAMIRLKKALRPHLDQLPRD